MVDIDGEEKERRIKYKVLFPTGGDEASNLEKWWIYIPPYVRTVIEEDTFSILERS